MSNFAFDHDHDCQRIPSLPCDGLITVSQIQLFQHIVNCRPNKQLQRLDKWIDVPAAGASPDLAKNAPGFPLQRYPNDMLFASLRSSPCGTLPSSLPLRFPP